MLFKQAEPLLIDQFVASTRINRYELGVHKPDFLTAQNLAKVLELPVAYFYAIEDDVAEVIWGYSRAKSVDRLKIKRMISDLSLK